jgi:hypothetical protein
MEAGENSVIYMGIVSGPNKAHNICGKTKVTGTMQRGSTVFHFILLLKFHDPGLLKTGYLRMIFFLKIDVPMQP